VVQVIGKLSFASVGVTSVPVSPSQGVFAADVLAPWQASPGYRERFGPLDSGFRERLVPDSGKRERFR
jgi:hypothetical protein